MSYCSAGLPNGSAWWLVLLMGWKFSGGAHFPCHDPPLFRFIPGPTRMDAGVMSPVRALCGGSKKRGPKERPPERTVIMNPVIKDIEAPFLKTDIPYFRPGDTIRVSVRIKEGNKERIQDYEGVLIARSGSGVRETITVRRVSFGVGMERIFQLHSPRIEGIKVVRRGKVRRAKLYYLRNLRGKKARLTERRIDADKLSREAAATNKSVIDQVEVAEQNLAALQTDTAPAETAVAEAPEAPAEETAAGEEKAES